MKIGTLVKPNYFETVFPVTDEYIQNLGNWFHGGRSLCGFRFEEGEVGVVLWFHRSKGNGNYYKVLTPKGVGWVKERDIERV